MFNILRNISFIFALTLIIYMIARGIYLKRKEEIVVGIEVYCETCGRYVEAEVIEIKESDSAFKEVVCKCTKCGKKHVVKIML